MRLMGVKSMSIPVVGSKALVRGVALGVVWGVCCVLGGCAASGGPGAGDAAGVRAEVGEFLREWNSAVGAGDESRVRSAYVDDGRLRWFEDGVLRYRSADEIVGALRRFPAGTEIETELSEIEVEAVSVDSAHGSAAFTTRLAMPGGGFEFSGVFTMLVERDEGKWVFVRGHTSTRRAEEGRGGM
ncbi:MAG: YybH family protein [Phycisphaerales bacterium]